MKKIMVALDSSPQALAALPPARALAQKFASEIHLVSVEMPVSPHGPEWQLTQDVFLDKKRQELEAYLQGAAEPLRGAGLQVSTGVLPLGSTVARLSQEIQTSGADLLVLYSHGRGGLSRLLFGSTVEQMNRRSSCPILVVHPPESENGELTDVP